MKEKGHAHQLPTIVLLPKEIKDVTREVVPPDGGNFVFQSVVRGTLKKLTETTTMDTQQEQRQHERRTAVYEGIKEFLIVRIANSGGLAHRNRNFGQYFWHLWRS